RNAPGCTFGPDMTTARAARHHAAAHAADLPDHLRGGARMTLWTPRDERGDKMTAVIGGHAATSSLNEVMEFDRVIRVLPNRQVDDDLAEVYAPEVYQDVDAEGSCLPDSDTHLIERLREQGWTAAV